ncbi:MAG UNVERIFIED_CONTAM: hypothetical protein LVT10_00250 [Anaerolineae bacterium]
MAVSASVSLQESFIRQAIQQIRLLLQRVQVCDVQGLDRLRQWVCAGDGAPSQLNNLEQVGGLLWGDGNPLRLEGSGCLRKIGRERLRGHLPD